MPLLGHIFDRLFLQKSEIVVFLESVADMAALHQPVDFNKYVSDGTISFTIASYGLTFNLGQKEASGTIAMTPFLLMVAQLLCATTRNVYYVDPQFVVLKTPTAGRNPTTDL